MHICAHTHIYTFMTKKGGVGFDTDGLEQSTNFTLGR